MMILIVDPNANRQRQLRTILTSIGYKSSDIEAVADARGAVERLAKKRFDCSFVSMLSTVDGLDLLKEVGIRCTSRFFPFIVYSSQVTRENVLAAVAAGATTFLAYPFSACDVENVMKRISTN